MPASILIVEDEEPLTLLLRYNLEAAGYAVESAARGDEAELKLRETTPDLIVLDWMLPGSFGHRVVPSPARAGGDRAAADHHAHRTRGGNRARARPFHRRRRLHRETVLGAGAARTHRRVVARGSQPERVAAILSAGDIELDRERRRVFRGGRSIELGPTEFRLLEHLMQHPGRVFSREQLLDGVWGNDVYIDDRTVDVHVGRLRKALNRGREADPVRTVRGSGCSTRRTVRKVI